MTRVLPLRAALTLLLALATSLAVAQAATGQADARIFKAHVAFLADDLLEGRETGTRGFDLAAHYVATQFAQHGVLPKGDPDGYLQTLPLKTGRLVPESPVFEIRRKGGVEALTYLNDFAMSPVLSADQTDITAPLIFVGYGITAPHFKHDDYAGLDVKGKIVVLLGDRPAGWPTEEGAHYNNRRLKAELAARHGAVGMVYLQTPRGERVSPFAQVRLYSNSLAMDWVTPDGRGAHESPGLQGGAYLSMAAAAKLFSEVSVKLDTIYAAAEADTPLPHMDLQLSAHLAVKTTRNTLSSANVVGMIEGSDAQLKNEYVVFTAHLDHLGLRQGMMADNLHNGAMDNATGVAALLEMARLVGQMSTKPRRSMLFIALTGEEKGLLGSDYFAANPTVPLSSMVACVNLDMPILTYNFSSVVAFGAEHSSLKQATAKAAATLNLALVPDPWPEQGIFTRSDHYSFVRQGVPSIYITPGHSSFNSDEDGAQIAQAFLRQNYHKPSDDMKQPFNWAAAARFAQLNYLLGVEIANDPKRASWNRGDFFGDHNRK